MMMWKNLLLAAVLATPLFSCFGYTEVQFIRQMTGLETLPPDGGKDLPWLPLIDTKAKEGDPVPADAPAFVCAATKKGFQFRLRCKDTPETFMDLELIRNTAGFNGDTVIRLRCNITKRRLYQIVSNSPKEWSPWRKSPYQIQNGEFNLFLDLNFSDLIGAIGKVPVDANRKERWEVRVSLVSEGKTFRVDPKIIPVYEFPLFHVQDIQKMRSSVYSYSVTSFFAKEPQTGSYYGHNMYKNGIPRGWFLAHISDYYTAQELWTVNWRIPKNVCFPVAQSWLYYLDIYKWESPLKSIQEMKRKEAQDGAEKVNDMLIGNQMFMDSYPHFGRPAREWEIFRLEGIRHHMFSKDYMGKE